MGTRSTTTILDDGGTPLVTMYRQFDGYLSGHGADLKKAFANTVIVNGINHKTPEDAANGMDCFAAQVIAKFKRKIGDIYLVPIGQTEEWNYFLYSKDNRIWVRILENGYDGPLADLDTGDK